MHNEGYLFVYGTLKREFDHPMAVFLRSLSQFIGIGLIHGVLYEIDGYPGLVASENITDQVAGEVYFTENLKEVLSELDMYEECGDDFQQPCEYVRRKELVNCNGKFFECEVYFYNWSVNGLSIVEGDWTFY